MFYCKVALFAPPGTFGKLPGVGRRRSRFRGYDCKLSPKRDKRLNFGRRLWENPPPFFGWSLCRLWLFGQIARDRGRADVAKLVYALDLGSSGATRESSSLSVRTILLTAGMSLKAKARGRHDWQS